MKIERGEFVKKARQDLGMSREEFATRVFISERQLARIESGETEISVWQFMDIMERQGLPSEDFWVLSLETSEYDGYKMFRRIRRCIRDDKFDQANELLDEFEDSPLSKQPFIKQIIMNYRVKANKDIPPQDAVDALFEALHMSMPDFDEDELPDYKLNQNETSILNSIAVAWAKIEETERAIKLLKNLIESIENKHRATLSEEEMIIQFPSLLFNLSNMLGRSGKWVECLEVAERAIKVSRYYNNLGGVPQILLNIAYAHKELGEEERVYKMQLQRAYHCAYGMGKTELAKRIKKYAEEDFGILEL